MYKHRAYLSIKYCGVKVGINRYFPRQHGMSNIIHQAKIQYYRNKTVQHNIKDTQAYIKCQLVSVFRRCVMVLVIRKVIKSTFVYSLLKIKYNTSQILLPFLGLDVLALCSSYSYQSVVSFTQVYSDKLFDNISCS